MMTKIIIALFLLIAGFAFSASLNNGTINVGIKGNGTIDELQYMFSNQLKSCSLRFRQGSSLVDTTNFPSTEKTYIDNLFIGYGESINTNFYIYTAAFISGNNQFLEQTCVLIPKIPVDAVGVVHFLNPSVQGTFPNDTYYDDCTHEVLTFVDGDEAIGLKSEYNYKNAENLTFGNSTQVVLAIKNNVTNGINDLANNSGAVWWNTSFIEPLQPSIIQSRLIAVESPDPGCGVQSFRTIDDKRVEKVPDNKIEVKKVTFKQNFLKPLKDKISIKAEINIQELENKIDNLDGIDVAFYIGGYLAFTSGDITPTKPNSTKLLYKTEDILGKRKLLVKLKKNILKITFVASKANISDATLISKDIVATDSTVYIPFTISLTGIKETDEEKRGKVWIAAKSAACTYSNKKGKEAKGKQVK